MTDLDPNSLIVGIVFGAVMVLSVVAMICGARREQETDYDDEIY